MFCPCNKNIDIKYSVHDAFLARLGAVLTVLVNTIILSEKWSIFHI